MRKIVPTVILFLVAALMPAPASAWGTAGHRYIMARAIELLPPPLKPFFEQHKDELVLRSTDPDNWRSVGWDEDPNHFVDFGVPEYGAYPFDALPRELGAAIEKFGTAALKRNGTLPWRTAEEFGNLRRTFEGLARGAAYGQSNIVLFTSAMSHYIQDAHQPLHATINYDGQLTNQTGLHARFEGDLIDRFQSRLTVTPAPPVAVTNVRDKAFDILLSSYQLVDPLLKADAAAIGSRDTYDDEYFETFFTSVKPILEKRLAESITATAGAIVGAWERAGKPALTTRPARPAQKVRKPKP